MRDRVQRQGNWQGVLKEARSDMKYLVSTETFSCEDGRRLDSWEGDYIEANSKENAMKESVEWEEKLLKENTDATDISTDKDIVYYTAEEEERYIKISIEEVE